MLRILAGIERRDTAEVMVGGMPVCIGAFSRTCWPLREGERKVARWYSCNHRVKVDFSDIPQQFSNINTQEDHACSAQPRMGAGE